MSAKKTILILCDWFLPGYLAGGPIQSVATLTHQLSEDFNFKIITTDRDFKSNKAYSNIKTNTWVEYAGRSVFYVSPENMNKNFVLNLVSKTHYDLLYLNSLFSPIFAVAPMQWKANGKINKPVILAPRGMLRDGALAVKPVKKQLFLLYAKCFGLFKSITWQSTSAQESEEIKKRIGYNAKVIEVPNFPVVNNNLIKVSKQKNKLRLCFIGRILDVKNLKFAIDVLNEVKNIELEFNVFGPTEDVAYWNVCKDAASKLSNNIKFKYNGVAEPQQIGNILNNHDVLFLPTRTENFGHVIVESLQHGRPVIISDATPWRNLQAENVGFDIPLSNKQLFIDAINKLASMNQDEFEVMSNSAYRFIQNKLNISDIKNKYIQLFSL